MVCCGGKNKIRQSNEERTHLGFSTDYATLDFSHVLFAIANGSLGLTSPRKVHLLLLLPSHFLYINTLEMGLFYLVCGEESRAGCHHKTIKNTNIHTHIHPNNYA